MSSFNDFFNKLDSQDQHDQFCIKSNVLNFQQSSFVQKHQNCQITESLILVEKNLRGQHQQQKLAKQPIKFDQNDSDIEDFTQEDQMQKYQRVSVVEEDPQEDYFSASNSSINIQPPYLAMTMLQKQKYFQRLNSEYLEKLQEGRSCLNLNLDSDRSTKLDKKPAIRFNGVVYEIPFVKQDEPQKVKYSHQEEVEIRFDQAAYQDNHLLTEYENQNQYQTQKLNIRTENSNYFYEINDFDFDHEIIKNQFFINYELKQHQNLSERDINSKLIENHESQQNLKLHTNIMDEFGFEDEENQEINLFKRNSSKLYRSEILNSDSTTSDSSSSEGRETDNYEEFESYFSFYQNGRKIKPNFATKQNETTC